MCNGVHLLLVYQFIYFWKDDNQRIGIIEVLIFPSGLNTECLNIISEGTI